MTAIAGVLRNKSLFIAELFVDLASLLAEELGFHSVSVSNRNASSLDAK